MFLFISLSTLGFAVLTNHGVDWNIIEKVYEEWRVFCSEQQKIAAADKNNQSPYCRNEDNQRGFFCRDHAEKAKDATIKDIKTYFQLYFPEGKHPRNFTKGPVVDPKDFSAYVYPTEVSDMAELLFDKLFNLGKQLLEWIWDHMKIEARDAILKTGKYKSKEEFMSMVDITRTMLRILHYPAYKDSDEKEGAVRASAHEDINLITVLPTGSSRGLQVRTGPGETDWFDVPVDGQSIVINVGDMLQELTDYEYIATTHRVVKPKGEVEGVDRM